MATYSVKIGNEIYVYVMGQLIMKRWIDTGKSVVFDAAPTTTRWKVRKSIEDILNWSAPEIRFEKISAVINQVGNFAYERGYRHGVIDCRKKTFQKKHKSRSVVQRAR